MLTDSGVALDAKKVLLDEVERAGDEPAESLLLLRVALASSSREKRIEQEDDTTYESFWFPRCTTMVYPNSSSNDSKITSCAGVVVADAGSAETIRSGKTEEGGQEDSRVPMKEDGAFFSFRVANRDNEVGLADFVVFCFLFCFCGC